MFGLVQHRVASCSSDKYVAIHLDSSPFGVYVMMVGAVSLLSKLVCYILILADRHCVTLITTFLPAHFIGKADYLSWGRKFLKWHFPTHIIQVSFKLWGQLEVYL